MSLKIPNKIRLGGQEIEIRNVDSLPYDDLGHCSLAGGYIEIANTFGKDGIQSESSKLNTYIHEVVHLVLDTMGELELSRNEKFVNCFAGFLTEALISSNE